ncbi:hypothetical protein [Planococcus lenghuensis]|nr:hypothetical protein [Planococcus lenghuensis]
MNYIETTRKMIGNELLMTIGCGIIIEQDGQTSSRTGWTGPSCRS